jgi:hypothetical protein
VTEDAFGYRLADVFCGLIAADMEGEDSPVDMLAKAEAFAEVLERQRLDPVMRCHSAAWAAVRATASESWQKIDGWCHNPLTGMPVHVDDTMAVGSWEILDGDDVVRSGNIFGSNPPTGPGAVVQSGGDTYWIADSALGVHAVSAEFLRPARVDPYSEIEAQLRRGWAP